MDFYRTNISYDLGCFLISVVLLIAYHVFLRYRLRANPHYTIQSVNALARNAWVDSVMAEGRDILSVQTLRNSVMTATFLASTAVLVIIGVLTLSGQSEKLGSAWHAMNAFGAAGTALWTTKIILLLLNFFLAFFTFSMAIRLFNHVGYMMNVPLTAQNGPLTPHYVAMHLNRAGRYLSIGMRAYYFSVPLVFWLFGPDLMVMSTVALIFLLYHLDRAPKMPINPEV